MKVKTKQGLIIVTSPEQQSAVDHEPGSRGCSSGKLMMSPAARLALLDLWIPGIWLNCERKIHYILEPISYFCPFPWVSLSPSKSQTNSRISLYFSAFLVSAWLLHYPDSKHFNVTFGLEPGYWWVGLGSVLDNNNWSFKEMHPKVIEIRKTLYPEMVARKTSDKK